jgi:hypothetical protein
METCHAVAWWDAHAGGVDYTAGSELWPALARDEFRELMAALDRRSLQCVQEALRRAIGAALRLNAFAISADEVEFLRASADRLSDLAQRFWPLLLERPLIAAASVAALANFAHGAREDGVALEAFVDAHHLVSAEALAGADTPLEYARRTKALWDVVSSRRTPFAEFELRLEKLPRMPPSSRLTFSVFWAFLSFAALSVGAKHR